MVWHVMDPLKLLAKLSHAQRSFNVPSFCSDLVDDHLPSLLQYSFCHCSCYLCSPRAHSHHNFPHFPTSTSSPKWRHPFDSMRRPQTLPFPITTALIDNEATDYNVPAVWLNVIPWRSHLIVDMIHYWWHDSFTIKSHTSSSHPTNGIDHSGL